MKIQIVNTNDEIIGLKDCGNLDYKKDIYRASALWITNSKGKILLARRSYSKKQNPGKWGPAVAGIIEDGETYGSNITKEAEEELGLKKIKPKKSIKRLEKGEYKHFTQWFILKSDLKLEDLKVNKEEVAEVKWFTKKEVLKLIETNSDEVLKGIKKWINLF
jgi:isopentenyldiphosphate isomerase|tara:strand:+ start:4648 stop:5133 length:486 start_codon:yes stop_codon:yes gene_type:complete